MPLALESYGLSNVGCVRSTNEDRFIVADRASPRWTTLTNVEDVPEELTGSLHLDHLVAVADGVGGQAGGEIASSVTLHTMTQTVLTDASVHGPDSVPQCLQQGIGRAKEAMQAVASKVPALKTMGTTLTLAIVQGDWLYLAHVGDSRLYLLRDGILSQETEDHTMARELVSRGFVDSEQDVGPLLRNTLSKAVVADNRDLEVESKSLFLREGDKLLLCTDGLTKHINDFELEAALKTSNDASTLVQGLVETALARGGSDNITAVVSVAATDGPVRPGAGGAELPHGDERAD